MKRRTLFIALGVLLLAIVLLAAALRLPATQRWLLLREVAAIPGLELKVERVSAGLSGAELRGIEVRYQGNTLRLPVVSASYDGWALLTRRELVVSELVATDLELVPAAATDGAGPGARNAPAAATQAFAGFLAPLQLPLKATIDTVQLGGRVQLSETQTVKFSAQGRLLLPGKAATTDIQLTWTDRGEAAVARELEWVGRITTAASVGGAVGRLELDGSLAMPSDKPGATEHGLVTRLVVAREPSGGAETIEATVRLSTAKETEPPVATASLTHRPGDDRIEGTWSVKLRREQLEGVVALDRLPDFAAEAQGGFKFAAATGDFSADGQAAFSASKLSRLRPEFLALGALTGKLDFAIERHGSELRLAKLEAVVNDEHGPLLKLAARQPVTYRLDTRAVLFAQPNNDLVRLGLTGFPLAWVQPWLGDTSLGGTIGSGEIRLKGAGSAWSVETAQPLAFSGVRVGRGGKTVADQLGGDLALRASVDGAAWSVDSLALNLRPAAADAALGALAVKLEARQDAAGRGQFALPLTLDNGGRRSQLKLEGEWTSAGGATAATARLSGDTVHLRDLGALAALLPKTAEKPATAAKSGKAKSKTKAAAEAPRVVTKDTQAFWAGIDGRFDVAIQHLVLESEELTGLQATLVCDARKLSLEKLAAKTRSAALEAQFGVTFDAAKSEPYALQGSCTFPGFDLGAWMRAANPDEEPAIETVLDVTAKLEGQGASLDDLLAGIRGDFVLKGGPGVLRIKDKRVEKASALGGLVLGLLSKDKQQKPAVVAGTQLLEELREFRFERIDASLLRGEDMNLQFRTIDVRSAEKRLTGSGMAKQVAGRTIDEYPLQLEMRLAGKGNFAALLDQVHLLDGSMDDLGYQCMREPFTVSGTVGEPNWKKMLVMLGTGLALGK